MIQRIALPVVRKERLWGAIVIGAAAAAVLVAPVDPAWRVVVAAVTALAGARQWRRYLRSRPRGLIVADDGGLVLERRDGSMVTVAGVRTGIVGPRLLSARFQLVNGERIDLLLPGSALAPDRHWAVRRAVLGHRRDTRSA